ncbi:Endoglucanase-4 [Drechslerella dactyloides]|uniref:lytic cellulose monooxygenase (C4-dehydrogenating) n=1 Tax=Drechslerella dactyloides TaxID=74499 RepID=A0AAD6IQ91_DREDA|nr:Endoglucanase-4 [Drechslerella dactyloides]
MKSTSLLAALSAVTSVMGHGYIFEYVIDGKSFAGYNPYSASKYASGITQAWTPPVVGGGVTVGAAPPVLMRNGYTELACQRGAKPAPEVAPASAGSKISFYWNQWPPTHRGPIITWLGDCGGDCRTVDATQMNWFKIDEAGVMNGKWASEIFVAQGNRWTIQLPKNIKSGQYIMRHDVVNLEDNPRPDGAQFYPHCTNLEISGGTAQSNPRSLPLNKILVANDPSLKVLANPGAPVPQTYVVPGGRVDPSLQVTLSSDPSLNDGTADRKKPPYPNEEVDPYPARSKGGSAPNTGTQPGNGSQPPQRGNQPPSNQQPPQRGNQPTNPQRPTQPTNPQRPSQPVNGTPQRPSQPANPPQRGNQPANPPQRGNQGTVSSRKVCDDAHTKCSSSRQRSARDVPARYMRRDIWGRSPQADYTATDPCRAEWEQCMKRVGA